MRRRYSKKEKIKICDEWKQSGLKQKEFCEQKDMHIKSLSRWLYQIRKDKQSLPQEAIKFLPIGNIAAEKNYLEIVSPKGITCKVYLPKENILNFLGRLLECK